MVVSATISTSPTLVYFGQELGETGATNAGFGKPTRTSIFEGDEERNLATAIAAVTPIVEGHLAVRDYAAALRQLATLRPAVDAFFDKVMVMADEPAVRTNRLMLLASMQRLFLEIADLSRLPG